MSESIIEQLEREREEAEERYAAALAALDATVQAMPVRLPAAYDADIDRLNRVWNPAGDAPTRGSIGARLRRVAAEIGRLLPWRRRAFNGALVAVINRNAEITRDLLDALRQHAGGAIRFQSHAVWYAQAIGLFVDTRSRTSSGLREVQILQAAMAALTDDWMKRWESLQTREQRYEARAAALTQAYMELRDIASLAQQSTISLKRAVEVLTIPRAAGAGARSDPSPAGIEATAPPVDLDAFKYVGFEDRFRGSRDDIRERLGDYVAVFAGATDVIDLGCGRGELLDLFRENGIGARGLDTNGEMVEVCRARGLEAVRADALEHLTQQPDASLGGVVAIQVVEHLDPAYLARLIETAYHKLRPGAPLVLETINVACWTAFFDSYIRDLTHVRPLHPDTLRYLVQAGGFTNADVQFRSPVAPHDQLPSVRLPPPLRGVEPDASLIDVVDAINAHADKLNARLFTHRDYVVIGRK